MSKNRLPADGERFYSKRNTVTYDGQTGCVKKAFEREEDFLMEHEIYRRLADVPQVMTPKLMASAASDRVLSIEFLQGNTLLEMLEKQEACGDKEKAVDEICGLLDWLERFYEAIGDNLIMKDVNFRNFLWHEGQLYGFDFEAVCEGDRKRESCMVLAMYLLYDPVETVFKKEVCKKVMKEREMGSLTDCIDSCIEEVRNRRKRIR